MKPLRAVWVACVVAALAGSAGLAGEAEDEGWVSLFDGETLDGWVQINGKATYKVDEGTILGETVPRSPNSFLCTRKHYGDFELEFDVKVDPRLNSGCQIRSNSRKDYKRGRVHGYQVEIATHNAGRIYDEARRGKWLDAQKDYTAEKRKAFKPGEWNHYRVRCEGSRIQTWVNGVQIVDITDEMTKSGFIGLQVHSFRGPHPAWVRWKNLRIRELGEKKE